MSCHKEPKYNQQLLQTRTRHTYDSLTPLSHILILVYIGTHNVDLDPFGKPPNWHPRIIMDFDILRIHMHKHTISNIRDNNLHAYLHIIYK